MSSVLHPVGPEPRERYWVRRVAVLVAAVVVIGVVIALVGNAMSAGSAVQAEPAAPSPVFPMVVATPSATPSASATPVASGSPTPGAATSGSPTPGATPGSSTDASPSPSPTQASGSADPSAQPGKKSDKKSDEKSDEKSDKKSDKKSESAKKPAKQPVPAACDGSQLRPTLTGDPSVRTGKKTTLALSLINGGEATCLAKVSTANVRLTVVSGSDRIWSTKDCPAAMPSTQRILLTQHALTWKVTWDGTRSGTGCSTSKEEPKKGYYWAIASVDGVGDVRFRIILT